MSEWRRVGDSNVEVSSDGRVRRNGVEFEPCVTVTGYRQVKIYRKSLRLHRLIATAFVDNPLMKPRVDHINGDKLDNRAVNLRWVTDAENNRNHAPQSKKKTGLPCGVKRCWERFTAQIYYNGIRIHIGVFDTAEEASDNYESHAAMMFGEYYRKP